MKPERSLVRIGCLPICSAKASARSTDARPVSSPMTISTSFMTGTGEKKCRPRTRWGSRVQDAIWAIGIDEVLDARMASRHSASRRWNSSPLTFGSS